jgi:hypothetical protein
MTRQLETADLVRGLTLWGDSFHAIDVFADDLSPGARADVEARTVVYEGAAYRFMVYANGVVAMLRDGTSIVSEGGPADATLEVAIAAAEQAKGGLVRELLGVLVGDLLNPNKASGSARHIFAMHLDPHTGEWVAYHGVLQRWMKSQLLDTRRVA